MRVCVCVCRWEDISVTDGGCSGSMQEMSLCLTHLLLCVAGARRR